MKKLLLLGAIVLAACERVVDLTPDATFAMQPDTAQGVPDAATIDDSGSIGDGDASPPPDAAVIPDAAVDAL